MLELCCFILGLLVGSFLNVCIYRWPLGLSVVRPRSFCPACKTPIAWYDNIPVLSFLVLKGRCRSCAHPISWWYPTVELATGLAFAAAVHLEKEPYGAVRLAVVSALLIGLAVSDLRSRILPDEFTLGGLAIGLLWAWLVPGPPSLLALVLPFSDVRWASLAEAAISAVALAGLLWMVGRLYLWIRGREGLGLGDVKLAAMLGAWFGFQPALLILTIGSVMGSVLGLGYIYLARKDPRSYWLPYGTFLAVAGVGWAFWRAAGY